MFIRELALRNFRSWHKLDIKFDAEPVILVGRNGFGKTNVLEALYFATNLRSHRVSSDSTLIADSSDSALIASTLQNRDREISMEIIINRVGANKVSLNTRPVKRHREVIGVLRSIMFSPEDLLLVRGEPNDRRRFLDEVITGLGPVAVAAKADYDRVVRQRAALLKTAATVLRRGGDYAESVIRTLDVWDSHLALFGAQVTLNRLAMTKVLGPYFSQAYAAIAPHSQPALLEYRSSIGPEVSEPDGVPRSVSDIEQILLKALAMSREKEIDRGVCLVGPHRDDLELLIGGQAAKGYASHGESWSLALALRLATVELARSDGVEPIIMLDDVFAELDARRREHLVKYTAETEQLFVTTAVPEDLPPGVKGRRLTVEMKQCGESMTDNAVSRQSLVVGDDKLDDNE